MKHVFTLLVLTMMSSAFSIAFGQTANHAVDFPGNQDGVRISDFQELDDLGSSVSFCSWYRVDEEALSVTNDGTFNPIIAKQYRKPEPQAPQTLLLGGYFYQGTRSLGGYVGTDHGTYGISVGDAIVLDEWQHSCVTLSPGVLKLYLNGIVLDSVATDPTAIINQNDDALEFGHRQDYPFNNTYTWGGQIQEVGIWDDALSYSEVNEVMLCGPGSVSSELIGYWPLNENSGTQVNDMSGLNHHGEFLGNLDWLEVDSTLTCFPGCMDATACNFDPDATGDDGSCIPSGCLEPDACNFDPAAECEGETCIYTCCPGPGCCDEGTAWSWESNTCVVVAPSDTDFDGCVGMVDLLDLLSAFGTCQEVGDDSEEEDGMSYCDSLFNVMPVEWLGTYEGLKYYSVGDSITWFEGEAFAQCLSPDFHLASIHSAEEVTTVVDWTWSRQMPWHWLGLYQNFSSSSYSEPEGGWEWSDGTPMNYTNWAGPEPNNGDGEEHHGHMNHPNWGPGIWNDGMGDVYLMSALLKIPQAFEVSFD